MTAKSFLMVFLGTLALGSQAARTIGFGADAYNRLIPSSFKKNAVFSPISFELDQMVIAESAEADVRGSIQEILGVNLSGFESEYGPIIKNFADLGKSNCCSFVSARAFCVPERQLHKIDSTFRRRLQKDFDSNILSLFPKEGAECWFRAVMDGSHDEFKISAEVQHKNAFAFYDLVRVKPNWLNPFPMANTRPLTFEKGDGTRCKVAMISDSREVEAWETKQHTMIRLPLENGGWFYAIKPNGASTLADLRPMLNSQHMPTSLAIMTSVVEPGLFKGPAVVAFPKMSIKNELDVTGVMRYFHFPIANLKEINGIDKKPFASSEIKQVALFELDERGDREGIEKKSESEQIRVTQKTKKFFFNRPFIFFIYDTCSSSIMMMGQFTGIEQ